MELGLKGRSAVVGGASEGLGLATARALAAEGARVLLCSRDPGKLAAAADSIGPDVPWVSADLSRPEGARELVAQARERLGEVDIVVANGGGPPPGLAGETDLELLRASLDRCLLAMVELIQGFVPGMRERGWGRVVAVTSTGVRQPLANMVYSNASRTGLTGYLKTLAREVIADGVTVNSILPGNMVTRRLESLIGDNMDAYLAALPAGRGGDPADFGRIAAFLCSEPAGYLTGVALSVDGGADVGLI